MGKSKQTLDYQVCEIFKELFSAKHVDIVREYPLHVCILRIDGKKVAQLNQDTLYVIKQDPYSITLAFLEHFTIPIKWIPQGGVTIESIDVGFQHAHTYWPPLKESVYVPPGKGVIIHGGMEAIFTQEMFQNVGKAFEQMSKAISQSAEQMYQASFGTIISYIAEAASTNTVAFGMRKHPGFDQVVECPAQPSKDGKCERRNLWGQIQHLNDLHKWKRERIANWLDTLPEQPVFYPEIEKEEKNDNWNNTGLSKSAYFQQLYGGASADEAGKWKHMGYTED